MIFNIFDFDFNRNNTYCFENIFLFDQNHLFAFTAQFIRTSHNGRIENGKKTVIVLLNVPVDFTIDFSVDFVHYTVDFVDFIVNVVDFTVDS
jgi:hypothetical protein